MGISLLTAMQIQGNKTKVGTYEMPRGGYGFAIYLIKNGETHTQLVSTDPRFPYSTPQQALKAGNNLLRRIEKLDLTEGLSR